MSKENKNKWTCPQCNEEFKTKPEDTVYTLKDEEVCQDCQENRFKSASTLYKFAPGEERAKVLFDNDFIYLDEINDNLEELPEPIKSQEWESTDGWRGYTDWKLNDGFMEFAGGWVTDSPDASTAGKAELTEYFNDLHDGEIEPPCDLYWLFGNTSNVFSQMSMIIIKKEDEKLLEEWLLKINGGREELQKKFE